MMLPLLHLQAMLNEATISIVQDNAKSHETTFPVMKSSPLRSQSNPETVRRATKTTSRWESEPINVGPKGLRQVGQLSEHSPMIKNRAPTMPQRARAA
jgi:hypothetical protein